MGLPEEDVRWAGLTARQMEQLAAVTLRRARFATASENEVFRMLARRGFRPSPARPDLPFPRGWDDEQATRLATYLGHYAFRLFLRGAILRQGDFAPEQATAYVSPAKARAFMQVLAKLGLASRLAPGRYRLVYPAKSFGDTLEWYVGRELHSRWGFEVATGVKFRARGLGGDLDVVATAEGKLVYLELKSSPPKHLTQKELFAFFSRVEALRPDIVLFVMDTALRLSDKVLPMFQGELHRRGVREPTELRQVASHVWALTPHVYAVNARPDLMGNISKALGEGLRALSPQLGEASTPL